MTCEPSDGIGRLLEKSKEYGSGSLQAPWVLSQQEQHELGNSSGVRLQSETHQMDLGRLP